MELKDRLKQARKNAGKSQKDVAENVGITQSTLSQLESGLISSSTFLPAIAKFLDVDAYWLQTGIGKSSCQITKDLSSNAQIKNEAEIPYFNDFDVTRGWKTLDKSPQDETCTTLRIPQSTLERMAIHTNNAVCVRAYGNSMSPTVKDGDTVYIDLGRTKIKDGKIFAINHGGLFYIKRLYNLPLGGVRLVSDNASEFPEIYLSAQEIIDQKFEVLGWVWQISSIDFW